MGYMGLEHYVDSDNASDLAFCVAKEVAVALTKELSETQSSKYNTCGPVNVALFFEAFICPKGPRAEWGNNESIREVANKTLTEIEKLVERVEKSKVSVWDCEENRSYHLEAYKRMAASLKEFIRVAD